MNSARASSGSISISGAKGRKASAAPASASSARVGDLEAARQPRKDHRDEQQGERQFEEFHGFRLALARCSLSADVHLSGPGRNCCHAGLRAAEPHRVTQHLP